MHVNTSRLPPPAVISSSLSFFITRLGRAAITTTKRTYFLFAFNSLAADVTAGERKEGASERERRKKVSIVERRVNATSVCSYKVQRMLPASTQKMSSRESQFLSAREERERTKYSFRKST
jgi:hypothetical protein